jgi:UDP-N-acetylmuramoyl-L-alanyl-D-glutamate--2,6-diaminopimelate ligase
MVAHSGVGGGRVMGAGNIEIEGARAIPRALDDAGEGDVIVLAGKGHEDYQETNGKRLRFSDRDVVADTLAGRDRA